MTLQFDPVPDGTAHRIELTMRVVTPLFTADGEEACRGIRSSAVKGALRFWWRALNWGRFFEQASRNIPQALSALHGAEADLFGSAAKQEPPRGGQARFILRVHDGRATGSEIVQGRNFRVGSEGTLGYLLGLGLYHYENGVLKDSIAEDKIFRIELLGKPGRHGVTDAQWASLQECATAFALMGNLGARARKGFGSLSLESASGLTLPVPATSSAYSQQIKDFLAGLPAVPQPPFSAFSGETRCCLRLGQGVSSGSSVLQSAARRLGSFRGWGQEGRVFGQTARRLFKADHDDLYGAVTGEGTMNRPPQRAIFGLPHNYRFSSLKRGAEVKPAAFERRASPLLLHVHRCSSGEYVLLEILLKADFLPARYQTISINPDKRERITVPATDNDLHWNVITDFMKEGAGEYIEKVCKGARP